MDDKRLRSGIVTASRSVRLDAYFTVDFTQNSD